MSLGNNAIKFKLFEPIYFLNVHHIILKHRYNLYAGLTGIVDYTNYDDVKYAIRKLDDSEFRNAFSRSYIRVREYDRSHSRSPSRDSRRSYSRSRSPYVSRSRSRSLSHSYSGRSRSLSPKAKHSRRSFSLSRCSLLRRPGNCMLGS